MGTLSVCPWETNPLTVPPEFNKGKTLKFWLNLGQIGPSNTFGKPNKQQILGNALSVSTSFHFLPFSPLHKCQQQTLTKQSSLVQLKKTKTQNTMGWHITPSARKSPGLFA